MLSNHILILEKNNELGTDSQMYRIERTCVYFNDEEMDSRRGWVSSPKVIEANKGRERQVTQIFTFPDKWLCSHTTVQNLTSSTSSN